MKHITLVTLLLAGWAWGQEGDPAWVAKLKQKLSSTPHGAEGEVDLQGIVDLLDQAGIPCAVDPALAQEGGPVARAAAGSLAELLAALEGAAVAYSCGYVVLTTTARKDLFPLEPPWVSDGNDLPAADRAFMDWPVPLFAFRRNLARDVLEFFAGNFDLLLDPLLVRSQEQDWRITLVSRELSLGRSLSVVAVFLDASIEPLARAIRLGAPPGTCPACARPVASAIPFCNTCHQLPFWAIQLRNTYACETWEPQTVELPGEVERGWDSPVGRNVHLDPVAARGQVLPEKVPLEEGPSPLDALEQLAAATGLIVRYSCGNAVLTSSERAGLFPFEPDWIDAERARALVTKEGEIFGRDVTTLGQFADYLRDDAGIEVRLSSEALSGRSIGRAFGSSPEWHRQLHLAATFAGARCRLEGSVVVIE